MIYENCFCGKCPQLFISHTYLAKKRDRMLHIETIYKYLWNFFVPNVLSIYQSYPMNMRLCKGELFSKFNTKSGYPPLFWQIIATWISRPLSFEIFTPKISTHFLFWYCGGPSKNVEDILIWYWTLKIIHLYPFFLWLTRPELTRNWNRRIETLLFFA